MIRDIELSPQAVHELNQMREDFEFPLDDTLLETMLEILQQLEADYAQALKSELETMTPAIRAALSRAVCAAVR